MHTQPIHLLIREEELLNGYWISLRSFETRSHV